MQGSNLEGNSTRLQAQNVYWTRNLLARPFVDSSLNFILYFVLILGDGAPWLGSHTAQRAASAVTSRRDHPRQGHGWQPLVGWWKDHRYHLQVRTVIRDRFLLSTENLLNRNGIPAKELVYVNCMLLVSRPVMRDVNLAEEWKRYVSKQTSERF